MVAVFGVLLPSVVKGEAESGATFVARKWVQSLVGNGHPDIFHYGGMTETPTRTGGRPGIPAAMANGYLPFTPSLAGSSTLPFPRWGEGSSLFPLDVIIQRPSRRMITSA